MRLGRLGLVALLCLGMAANSCLAADAEDKMTARGTFSVDLAPQEDTGFPAGRMLMDKSYSGDLTATAAGQMISKRTDAGTAVYYAVEEVSGVLNGRRGGFTLVHRGYMDDSTRSLQVEILKGSGSGGFEGITGSMSIFQDDGGHQYELVYEF
ncbi:MAG: DUF3224 domain-containing protein [Xanthomonadales bacterium]|nr:DUF3224 domain-containing protein [Xanthomonadales bacterium]